MKKILKLLIGLIITVTFVACDNNDGPFEIKRENGHKVIYSNGKLAKGMIESTWYDFNSGETVVTSTYYVEKGIPAGDFTLYDRNGNTVATFKGKVKNELFVGKMTGEISDDKSSGEYNLNPDWLISYDGEPYEIETAKNMFSRLLYTGEVDATRNKLKKKNGKIYGTAKVYDKETGKLTMVGEWKDGKEILLKKYWKNGNIKGIYDRTKDENGDYTWLDFFEDGEIYSIRLLKDPNVAHCSNMWYNNIRRNGTSNIKHGDIFAKMSEEEIIKKYSKKYNF